MEASSLGVFPVHFFLALLLLPLGPLLDSHQEFLLTVIAVLPAKLQAFGLLPDMSIHATRKKPKQSPYIWWFPFVAWRI